ncbi:MAG: DNA-formamidopyrimidine glycosylase family protein, partial [Caldimonas sp.]
MPELPEVEVTRLSFADRIRGARVTGVRLGKPLRWPLGVDPASLAGQTVGDVTRRGKYLWLALERGGLLLHLGMSGSLAFGSSLTAPGPHDHFDLVTERGTLRLTDPRRFGAVVWAPGIDAGVAAKLLAVLGLEPFDDRFDGAHLHAALKKRRV